MKTQMRIFWLVSLLFFTTGCSIYQPACFTGAEGVSTNDMSKLDDCQLQPGDTVRITTTNGDKLEGEIQRLTEDWIVLENNSKKESPRLLTPSQILVIEKSKAQPKDPDMVEPPMVGEEVYLFLVDGSGIKGEVSSVDDEALVLIHESGANQRLEFPMDEILWVDTSPNSSSGGLSNNDAVWVVLGVAVLIGIVVMANEMSKLNNMFEN